MSDFRIIHGSCADQKTDAVVNAANCYLQAGGGICGAIFSRAGMEELQAACNKYPRPIPDGGAVITPSFKMTNCSHIIHAVGPDFRRTPGALDKLQDAYYNSFAVLKENNLHTIALPLISASIFAGNLKNPAARSAQQCRLAYEKFISDNPEFEIDVTLCAFTEKEYAEIKNA